MSEPLNHPERGNAPRAMPSDEVPRKDASPVLWIVVLLALLALLFYFMSRRDTVLPPPEPATPIGDAAPVETAPPPAATAARREAPAQRRQPAVQRNRDARPLQHPAPEYPVAAARAGDEGTVLVRAQIDASGKPGNVELAQRSRSRDLDRAALAAVRQWTFEPAIRDGKAVASTVQVPVDFRLDRQ